MRGTIYYQRTGVDSFTGHPVVIIIYMTSYPQLIVKKFPLLSIDKTACAVEPQPNTTRVKVPGT